MYSFDFLNKHTDNTMLIFHNETGNVASGVVTPLRKELAPLLNKRYSDRSTSETLICLKYPEPGLPELVFMQFFDSPSCASIYRKEFKGVFVIDCSTYTSTGYNELCRLTTYIKENASEDFRFIVLFNRAVKAFVQDVFRTQSVNSISFINLELDKSSIEVYREKLDKQSYQKLSKSFDNPVVREKSLNFVTGVLDKAIKANEDIDSVIAKLSTETKDTDRRIGF